MSRADNVVACIPTPRLHLSGKLGVQLPLEDLEHLIHPLLQPVHAPSQLTGGFVIIPNKDLFDERVNLPPLMLKSPRSVGLALGVQALQDLVELQGKQLL